MKSLKVFLTAVLLITSSILLFSCKSEEDVIKLGASAPLTGENANYGRSTKQGIDLAVHELNESSYLGKKLEIIYEDDKMLPNEGVKAVNKLINVDKVPVILGPFGSSVVLATAPIANKNRTIIISASATADDIADAGDYVFRITPPNSKQGSDIADFSYNKLNARRAGVIFQNNDYGVTLKDAFVKQFEELGGEVVSIEGANGGESDFRSQLVKIKNGDPDVVFFPQHYKESAQMLKQSRQLGISAKFISADGAMTEDMLKIAGEAAEGTYYSTLALGFGIADEKIQKFNKSFADYFKGENPDIYAAYYYEVTNIVAKAIKEVGTNTENIKEYLYKMNGGNAYKGVTGITSFDSKGEVDKSFYIYTVQNSKFIIVQNQ